MKNFIKCSVIASVILCSPNIGLSETKLANMLFKKNNLVDLQVSGNESPKDAVIRIKNKILTEKDVLLFGNDMDNLEKMVAQGIKSIQANKNDSISESDGVYNTRFEIPDKYFGLSPNFFIDIDKKERLLRVYNANNDNSELFAERLVALGGINKNYATGKREKFETPSGIFYIKNIRHKPIWFPPGWAQDKTPVKPGKKNPYGDWMSELYTTSKPYNPDKVFDDSGIRIHATNAPSSIGSYASHGCIRLHPNAAKDLFEALLFYIPHKDKIRTWKGETYVLETPVKVMINRKDK